MMENQARQLRRWHAAARALDLEEMDLAAAAHRGEMRGYPNAPRPKLKAGNLTRIPWFWRVFGYIIRW